MRFERLLENGRYIITGGAIKLTATMREREHTLMELKTIMKRTDDKELHVLEQHEVSTDWREKATWRKENRRWLRYSGYIALKVMNRLEQLSLSQKELAERLGCSPQYVSKLLKGTENLTLETISKLEVSLNLDLLDSIMTYVDGYAPRENQFHIVAEPEQPPYGNCTD